MDEATSRHRVGGLVVAIEAPPDPLFERVRSGAPDIVVERAACHTVDRAWKRAGEAVRHGDVLVATLADGGWVVRYPQWFDAVVDREGRRILVSEQDRWSGFGRALFTTVVPLALAQHGRVAFHGSAVAVGGVSLVLVGGKGAGKSTMASALCLEGARLLADDIAYARLDANGTVLVEPSAGATRLYPEVAERMGRGTVDGLAEKRLLTEPAVRSAGTSAPLASVHLLEPRESADAPVLLSVRGADAVKAVLHHMPAALGLSRRGQVLQHEVAMSIATRNPVQRLAWTPDASTAREMARDLIQEILRVGR